MQQASVVHVITIPLLRQAPRPLCKAVDVPVLLVIGFQAPLLSVGLVAC